MTVLQYLRDNLGLTRQEFMSEWKGLSKADREWYKQAAREEAPLFDIEISN